MGAPSFFTKLATQRSSKDGENMARPRPIGDEVLILKALAEISEADPITLGRKLDRTSAHIDYLCRYMAKYGYVEKVGRRYCLTSQGEQEL